jgi:hypothetical protein
MEELWSEHLELAKQDMEEITAFIPAGRVGDEYIWIWRRDRVY